jgi:hypothetical protein
MPIKKIYPPLYQVLVGKDSFTVVGIFITGPEKTGLKWTGPPLSLVFT